MDSSSLEAYARLASDAADRAREEILPRFRNVAVETKGDGSPVTEADRAAERVIRDVLRAGSPDFAIRGEEYDDEGSSDGPSWVIDPIDGTVAFSRGIPLFSTLIALVEGDDTRVGVLDVPTLDERYVAWTGGGCTRNGRPTRVSNATDLSKALISCGDPVYFDAVGERPMLERLFARCEFLRGYTDAFGHSQVLGGGIDAMVDFHLNEWDIAATRILVPEAGGVWHEVRHADGSYGSIFGSPALVETLLELRAG